MCCVRRRADQQVIAAVKTQKMNLTDLRDYEKWINRSPVVIRQAVIAAGGWARVFPMNVKVAPVTVKVPNVLYGESFNEPIPGVVRMETSGFPLWASRVRNYFNVTPITLRLLPPLDGLLRTSEHRRAFALLPASIQQVVFALNGDVYLDEHDTPWFNMIKTGTVYHFPGKVDAVKIAAAMLREIGRLPMPVFKLVSPDGTGGSMEVCLYNSGRAGVIGAVGKDVNVSHLLVRDEVYRGSYNYAETVERGLMEHDYADIKPHQEHKGFYLNPETYSAVGSRRFPHVRSNYNPVTQEWK